MFSLYFLPPFQQFSIIIHPPRSRYVSVSDMVSLMLLSKSCSRSTVLFDLPPERLCAGRKESFVLISSIDRSHKLGVLLGHDDYLYSWAHYHLGKNIVFK